MNYITINNDWLNNATKEELNRIIVCSNDGQGDHSAYTYDGMFELLMDSVGEDGSAYSPEMKPSEVVDNFYNGCQLTGNNTDALYFNGKIYSKINWVE